MFFIKFWQLLAFIYSNIFSFLLFLSYSSGHPLHLHWYYSIGFWDLIFFPTVYFQLNNFCWMIFKFTKVHFFPFVLNLMLGPSNIFVIGRRRWGNLLEWPQGFDKPLWSHWIYEEGSIVWSFKMSNPSRTNSFIKYSINSRWNFKKKWKKLF